MEVWAPVVAVAVMAVLILILSAMFRGALYKIISESVETEFHWGDKKVLMKSGQSQQMLDSVFNSMKPLVDKVPIEERKRILNDLFRSPRPLRVNELFEGFTRQTHKDGPEHQILRNLRDAQLIRPIESGPWDGESLVEIKDFGRIMLNNMGSYILGR